MKVLFVTEYFRPETNAAAVRVYERARCWVSLGHQVTIVTGVPNFPQGRIHPGYSNYWRQEEELDGIRIVRVKTFVHPNRGRLLRILDQASFLPTAMFEAIRNPVYDVIVASSPTLFSALAAAIAGWTRKKPFVLEIGDLVASSVDAVGVFRGGLVMWVLRGLERFLYRRAQKIIVQTNSMKNAVVSCGISSDSISVISNGVNVSRFSGVDYKSRSEYPMREFVVGYIGTFGMAHQLDRLVDAAEILKACKYIKFSFLGDGSDRERLERMVRDKGLENVLIHGPVSYEAVPGAWGSVDVAVVSLRSHSTFETVIPSKIFEAMASGVPLIVAAPKGEATQLVETLGIGTVANSEPAQLASTILSLSKSRELLRAQSARALREAQRFDHSVLAGRYAEVLYGVIQDWNTSDAQ